MAVELGMDTFGDVTVDSAGDPVAPAQVIRDIVAQGELADQVDIDHFSIGEHHRPDYAVSAPDMVLASHMNIAGLRTVDENGRSEFSKSLESFTSGLFVPDESWTERGFLDKKISFIIDGLADKCPEVESELPINETHA
mgnify:FL=1